MKAAKKFLLVGLVMLLLISLAGCGNTQKVKEELSGEWGYMVQSINGPCYKIYDFDDDGTYESMWLNENAPSKNSESKGTYNISSSKITLTQNDGDTETIIEYTFDDDELELVDKLSDNSGNRKLIRLD